MRATAISILFMLACGDDRHPVEAPFITCPVADAVRADDGTWVGTVVALVAPPGTFSEELVGAPLNASLVGQSDDKLEVVRSVREDGGLYAVIEAESTDVRGLPVRVGIGPTHYIVHPPPRSIEIQVDHDPAIVERPDEQMSFSATVYEPLELGAFLSHASGEMIELPPDTMRIDARLEGHEGDKAIVGIRTESGTACFGTPCGCSAEVRGLGRCGAMVPPVDPDEPI